MSERETILEIVRTMCILPFWAFLIGYVCVFLVTYQTADLGDWLLMLAPAPLLLGMAKLLFSRQ